MLENLSQQVENDHFLPWNALKCVVGWGSAPDPAGIWRSPNPLAVEGEGRRFCVMSPGAHDSSYASGFWSHALGVATHPLGLVF